LNGLLRNNLGTDDWSGGLGDGSGENALDPTNGNLDGQLLHGLDHPLHGEEHGGSGFQNEVDGGTHAEDGGGHLPEFENTPDGGGQTEDHSPFNRPPVTEPDPGPVSSVPEPGSLVLLSLGLGVALEQSLYGVFARPSIRDVVVLDVKSLMQL